MTKEQQEHDSTLPNNTYQPTSPPSLPPSSPKYRDLHMIEFFSGIGGMRLGVQRAIDKLNNENDREENVACRLSHCTAFEISLYANDTYRRNFHCQHHHQHCEAEQVKGEVRTKLIEQLSFKDVSTISTSQSTPVDLWTMSPPCQPFTQTRGAKGRDEMDKRNAGFKAIMRLLRQLCGVTENLEGLEQHKPQRRRRRPREAEGKEQECLEHNEPAQTPAQSKPILPKPPTPSQTLKTTSPSNTKNPTSNSYQPPRYILLENVQPFQHSTMATLWRQTLHSCGYSYKEYILCSTQLGIPNCRTRYYCLCELGSRFARGNGKEEGETLPVPPRNLAPLIPNHTLSCYLHHPTQLQPYLVSHDTLSQPWAQDLPVIKDAQDPKALSRCFTAGYGRILHASTGSLLLVGRQTGGAGGGRGMGPQAGGGAAEEDAPEKGQGQEQAQEQEQEQEQEQQQEQEQEQEQEQHQEDKHTNIIHQDTHNKSNTKTSNSKEQTYKEEGKVRRFTPHEILSLLGFSTSRGCVCHANLDQDKDKDQEKEKEKEDDNDNDMSFFSKDLSLQHQYKLAGNSVNVHVVAWVLAELLQTFL